MDEHNKLSHQEKADDRVFFGFWIYMMTDLLMFAVLFATYTILRNNTHGGISIGEIFDPPFVLAETLILLASSFTIGLALLALKEGNKARTLFLLIMTVFMGLTFLAMEFYEFSHLLSEGHSYTKSAFLSSFFSLVGFHGMHIFAGTTWLILLIVHIATHGIRKSNARKLQLAGIFWHFLDIVWIFIFTIVYLMGGIL